MSAGQTFDDPRLVALAAALDFTPEDLAANRRGTLSARQIALLCRDQRRRTWPGLIAMGLVAVMLIGLALFGSVGMGERILVVVGSLLLVAYCAYEAVLAQRAITGTPDRVESLTWCADATWRPVRHLAVVEFMLAGRWFAADHALIEAIDKGQRYRLYYYASEWSYSGVAITVSRWERVNLRAHHGSYRVLSVEPAAQTE